MRRRRIPRRFSPLIPTPCPLSESFGLERQELAEDHRREDCAAYNACLSRAADENWRGLSCGLCRAYSREELAHVGLIHTSEIAPGREPPRCDEDDDGQPLQRSERLRRITAELSGLPPELWAPIYVAAEPGRDGRHREYASWFRIHAAARLEVACLRVVRVARAVCPVCRRTTLLGESIRANGLCAECRRYVVARGARLALVAGPDRDKALERERREVRPTPLRPRGASAVLRAIGAAATAAAAELEQLDLDIDDGARR